LADDWPDRIFFKAEIGVGETITQSSNPSPGHDRMTLLNLCGDLPDCFAEQLRVAKNSVENKIIAEEMILN
jgi:hypothetical protein